MEIEKMEIEKEKTDLEFKLEVHSFFLWPPLDCILILNISLPMFDSELLAPANHRFQ